MKPKLMKPGLPQCLGFCSCSSFPRRREALFHSAERWSSSVFRSDASNSKTKSLDDQRSALWKSASRFRGNDEQKP